MYCFHCMEPMKKGSSACPKCGKTQYEDAAGHHLPPGTILQDRYLVGKAIKEDAASISYIGRDIQLGDKIVLQEFFPKNYASRDARVKTGLIIAKEHSAAYAKAREEYYSDHMVSGSASEKGTASARELFRFNNTCYAVTGYQASSAATPGANSSENKKSAPVEETAAEKTSGSAEGRSAAGPGKKEPERDQENGRSKSVYLIMGAIALAVVAIVVIFLVVPRLNQHGQTAVKKEALTESDQTVPSETEAVTSAAEEEKNTEVSTEASEKTTVSGVLQKDSTDSVEESTQTETETESFSEEGTVTETIVIETSVTETSVMTTSAETEVTKPTETRKKDEEKKKQAFFTVKNEKVPESIIEGKTFSIGGEITCESNISKVTAGIYDVKGNVVKEASSKPGSKSYDVKKLDKQLTFGKLSVGVYRYKITAESGDKTEDVKNVVFTVLGNKKNVDEGIYILQSELNHDYCAAVENDSDKKRENICLMPTDPDNEYMQFIVEYLDNGYYKITALGSDFAMDVEGDGRESIANVHQNRDSDSKSQRWQFIPADEEKKSYYLVSECAQNRFLEVENGKSEEKANIQIRKGNMKKAQRWRLKKVED